MTTKTKTYSERIRDQRRDIDETMDEWHKRRDELRYRRDLSDEGKSGVARALRDQYLANLTSDAAAGWKIATAAVASAKADYQRAHAAHNERLDAGRLAWLAREYSAKLSAAPYVGAGVGSFDVISWLGRERDRLADANDVVSMRALRCVAREALPNALDSQSAGRLALVLQHDEDSERADVLAAEREVQAAERAADDLRRRIEQHRQVLDPHATDGLSGPDGFAQQVFGDAPTPPGRVVVG